MAPEYRHRDGTVCCHGKLHDPFHPGLVCDRYTVPVPCEGLAWRVIRDEPPAKPYFSWRDVMAAYAPGTIVARSRTGAWETIDPDARMEMVSDKLVVTELIARGLMTLEQVRAAFAVDLPPEQPASGT